MASATKTSLTRFSRYAVVGLVTNSSIFLAYLLLIWLGTVPIIASGLCYVAGVSASYLLNRNWTFASTSNHLKDMTRFGIAYGTGLAVTLMCMYVLVGPFGPVWAQIVTIGVTAVSIFTVLELLKFGR